MREFLESIEGFVRFFGLIIVLAIGFRIVSLLDSDKSKASFNACRDAGGNVIQCFTGLK